MPDDLIEFGDAAEDPVEKRAAVSRTKRVVGVLALLVGLGFGGFYGFAAYLDYQIQRGIEWLDDPFGDLPNRPPIVPPAPGADEVAVNILLLGSDSRISAGDPSQWEQGAQRTDTIMLLHLPADREKAYVMSIPRDSWVPIPGYGEAKINAAFSYGGPPLLVQTFEDLTGIRIDHIAIADFDSFARLTDHLGGVEITIPETTFDRRRGESIPAGTYQLNGEEALDYVRQRYGLPDGDLDRVQRQQNWIRAIVERAMDQGVLDNPYELTRVLLVLSDSIAADEGLTVDEMRRLAMSTRPIDEGKDLTYFTAPITGLGTSADGQSIVVLNMDRLGGVCDAIAVDDAGQFLADHPGYLKTLGEMVR